MSFPAWPIQKAVAARLAEHEASRGYVVTDNDRAAGDGTSPYPYIKLGESTGLDLSTTTTEGNEHTLTTHFWAERSDQVMQMMQAYDAAISDGEMDLSADGFAQIGEPLLEFYDTFHDFDDARGIEIRHGVMRHRFFIQKLPV